MSDVGAPPVVRIRWLEAGEPLPELELRSADEWQILLELDGTACASVRLPYPGEGAGEAFLTATLLRHLDGRRARAAFVQDFRERLGAPPQRRYRARTVSVVVSTHRRPDFLAGALEGLAELDPAPLEVIVVDNDPGDQDCREHAERAGARYVREDRRGLNAARTAGARAARGELVAYLDDDCVPARHWLGQLPELFDDPLVAAVTGPAFAYELTTPAQRRRDEVAGFVHGFGRTTYDWTSLRPVHSGRVGAGANMIFRRDRMAEIGELFSPDLDAGTASRSGGDLYALYRVLAAGYRITYDPATYVFHRHRPDAAALTSTVRGYGVGVAAYLTKALVEERELASFAIWRWLPQQYLVAVVARATGRGDAVAVRLRWEYLASSFRGPRAWLEARRAARAGGELTPVAHASAAETRPPRSLRTTASVVVTGADAATVERCCAALRSAHGDDLEVIAVPGRDRASRRNAGAASAAGEVLVFLDGDVVPQPDLIARYVDRLADEDEPLVVLGYSASRPAGGLAAMHEALDWEDHFSAKRDAVSLTFADFLASNMAMRRSTFDAVGEFDAGMEARDDWDWGARALLAGVRAEFDPDAVAHREPAPVSVLQRIARAHAQGRDEVRLHERYGITLAPAPQHPRLVRAFTAALDQGGALPAAGLLDWLELMRARKAWLALFRLALGAARRRGWRQAGGHGEPGATLPTLDVDLDADDAITPRDPAPPALRLSGNGQTFGRLLPRRAQWHGGLADDAVGLVAGVSWNEKRTRWWTVLPQRAVRASERSAEPAGGTGRVVVGDEQERRPWHAFDSTVREQGAGVAFVALLLPGVAASPEWQRVVAPAFEASRVAAVVGAGLGPGEPPTPLVIHSRASFSARYAVGLGQPFQYIAVSPQAYEALGGIDLATVAYGDYGPILDFLERALEAGWVIGYRDTPGLTPAGAYRPTRTVNEWARWEAGGALLARSARRSGGALEWLQLAGRFADGVWMRLVAGDGRRWWIGTRLAFLSGVRKGVRG